jgi:hypothetical protein
MRTAAHSKPADQSAQPAEASLLLTAPLELKAADGGQLPTRFAGAAYTGGMVPGYGVVIDMATTTYKDKLPLLAEHWRSDVVGVIEQAETRDWTMLVAGKLFSDMEGSQAEKIGQLASRGVPFEMSVGLYHFTREFVPAGKSVQVNGQTFQGPVDVLRNGVVREVSIVVLGADAATNASFFSASRPQSPQLHPGAPLMDLAQLQARVAELEAAAATHAAALSAARAESAAAELARIRAVHEQAMPGHEKLLLQLMFDGKTSGAEAAVQVLAAERAQLAAKGQALQLDAPRPVTPAAAPAVPAQQQQATDDSLPLAERAKRQWDADANVRREFATLDDYTAFLKADAQGRVRRMVGKASA